MTASSAKCKFQYLGHFGNGPEAFGHCLWVPPVNEGEAFGRAVLVVAWWPAHMKDHAACAAIPVQATTTVATARTSDEHEHEPLAQRHVSLVQTIRIL